nr:sialidase family protein [Methylomarinum sp. Ch1-1]MDP4520468.1 sialidase family protein [Methylomarinum sp. Ch1-1]
MRGNDAQITVQGDNIVVTWMSYVKGAPFNAGPMLAARSGDGGQTWQKATTPPDWKQGPHGYIDMTSDANAMHAVWLDSRGGRSGVSAAQALHYARSVDGGQSWQSNETLDELTCSCCWNTIKSNGEGKLYVLYRDKQPSDMAIGVIDEQQHWQSLNQVGAFNWQFEGCPHIGGGLDFQQHHGKKRIHAVVGSGHQDHLGVHYLFSSDAGKNWSAALPLGDESAVHADIAAHDNGRVVAVWDMMAEDGLAVFSAESSDSEHKEWSRPLQLSTVGARASHPRIVKTVQGFLALWTEHDGQQQRVAMRGL